MPEEVVEAEQQKQGQQHEQKEEQQQKKDQQRQQRLAEQPFLRPVRQKAEEVVQSLAPS